MIVFNKNHRALRLIVDITILQFWVVVNRGGTEQTESMLALKHLHTVFENTFVKDFDRELYRRTDDVAYCKSTAQEGKLPPIFSDGRGSVVTRKNH
jgi:hypothetical protein